jgi:hypothetical protein
MKTRTHATGRYSLVFAATLGVAVVAGKDSTPEGDPRDQIEITETISPPSLQLLNTPDGLGETGAAPTEVAPAVAKSTRQ